MGLHITSFSLYTYAAAVVDSMDELNLKQLSKEDYNKMKSEFSKYDIYMLIFEKIKNDNRNFIR